MDSVFPEQIIEKENLQHLFQKLSFRVLSTDFSVKELYDTGQKHVQQFVTDGPLGKFLSADMKMLEIGCGVGRLSRSFSYNFKEVHAVDIDQDMVNLSQILHRDRKNLYFHKVDGSRLSFFEDNYFDYVFSYYVFQHIREIKDIASYFKEIFRMLKSDGLFQIQVRRKLPGFSRNIVPVKLYNHILHKKYDYFFDKFRGKKWDRNRGCRLSPVMLKDLIRCANLELLEIKGDRDSELWCYGRKK